MPLADAAARLAHAHLAAVDVAAPGLVAALWITGSAASDDFRPGRSDVDFVAATARPPTPADLAVLARVHAVPDRPFFDGLYVPAAALADPPSAEEPVPHVVDGVFSTDRCGQCTPVGWLELREHGIAVRGPAPAELVAAPDPETLRGWLLGNLRGYWAAEAGAVERALADRPADRPASADGVTWLVLGAPRLHATLATGAVIAKSDAGRYAARHFPAWAELAGRCVAWRRGDDVSFTTADGLAAAALVRAVVADAR